MANNSSMHWEKNPFNEYFKYTKDMSNIKDGMETQNITKLKIS